MKTQMNTERRQRRSNEAQAAITFQLEHIHREFGFHAIVVASADGYLIGGSVDGGLDYAIAAYATAIGTAPPARRRVLINRLYEEQFPKLPNLELRVREFQLGQESAYLGMIGSPAADFGDAGERTISGVQRIYDTV